MRLVKMNVNGQGTLVFDLGTQVHVSAINLPLYQPIDILEIAEN